MTKRICSVDDCDNLTGVPGTAWGMCGKHYWRQRKFGTTDLPERKPFFRPCSVEDCDRPHRRNGYCDTHDSRVKRNGTTVPLLIYGDVPARFLQHVDKTDTCWLWTGVTNANGYAQFSVGKKGVLGHRWSYKHFIGPIPAGLTIDHLCYVRKCVNPAHLEPVTQAENTRRATERNRLIRSSTPA